MRLPRDLSGRELVKRLSLLGRQKGSHNRLTTVRNGEHHLTIPDHDSLRVGTLRSILGSVAEHFGTKIDELVGDLFPGE